MKSFLDSSVLIGALWSDHTHNRQCSRFLHSNGHLATSQHALLETYSTLTGLPVRPRHTPSEVRAAIAGLVGSMEVIVLGRADYEQALTTAEDLGIVGGAVYDLLHFQAAKAGAADEIVTLNCRHFQRFGADGTIIIREP